MKLRIPLRRKPKVVVYRAKDGWRWRRLNPWNGKLVDESGESYTRKADAKKAAERENRGARIIVEVSK